MSIITKILGSGGGKLIEGIGSVVDRFVTTDKEKDEMKIALMEVVNSDKDSARSLYKKDSWLQKVYGIVFLLGYIGISYYMMDMLFDIKEVNSVTSTFISMIFTAMSMKVNTITDFLFGGSLSENSKKK